MKSGQCPVLTRERKGSSIEIISLRASKSTDYELKYPITYLQANCSSLSVLALERIMQIFARLFSITEPRPAIRKKLRAAAWACTGITLAILTVQSLISLPFVQERFAFLAGSSMSTAMECVIALSVLSLLCTLSDQTLAGLRPSQIVAIFQILFCTPSLILPVARVLSSRPASEATYSNLPTEFALVFLLFGLLVLLEPAKRRTFVITGDCIAMAMSAVTIFKVFVALTVQIKIFRFTPPSHESLAPVLCLLLLSIAAILRRTDRGIFSIFLGYGIGSRIARYLCLLVLIVPYLREITRARILTAGRIPQLSATAGLAALASIIALGLVLLLAWWIASMESKIHSLTLRDGLTGLYNLRGLALLGEQSLQLARRAEVPFSVLYIDIDNLKHVNDTQGHAAGSQLLRETSEFLLATFRETDIVARVGGDEFVVTGQFNEEMLGVAVRRLGELCSRRNCEPGRMYDISFSIGHVTTHGDELESLEQLMARADRAMYETKHLKKAPTANHVEGKTVQPQPAQASRLLEQ